MPEETARLREGGQQAAAEVDLRQARELLEGLVRDRPLNQAIRARLADVYYNEGSIRVDLGHPEEALSSFRHGLEIFEKLAASNPKVAQCRSSLADGEIKLSLALRRLGHSSEALASLSKTTEFAEGLLADEPDSAGNRTLLAQGLTQCGNVLLNEGQAAEAIPMHRRAVVILEENIRKQPEVVSHKSSLANAPRGVGRAEAAAGHNAEARAAFERASEIDLSLAGTYPATRYNLACSLALMIPVAEPDRREDLARRAIDALQQATTAGYANVESIKHDSDLDALRPRADFQAFVAEIEAKAVTGN